MMGTFALEAAYKDQLPDCLCGNGEKAVNICIDEKCEYFLSLQDRLSKKRYYCEECMAKYHDHRPTKTIRKTFEIGQKWLDLDSNLAKYENQFNQNMHDHMDLINHYEEFGES